MRALLLAPILTAALTLLPAAAQGLPSVSLPADVDRVLRDYEAAWAANDATALAGLFAADGMALPSGKPPARGADNIRKAYSHGGGQPTSLRALDYRSSGDMAYIVGAYGPAGQANDIGKFVLVLRRVDGRWLIVADIENTNMMMGPQQRPSPKAP